MKYRHVVIRQFGGPEVLQVVEDDLAVPGSGQALIKVLAADVGFSDATSAAGGILAARGRPLLPGTPWSEWWINWPRQGAVA
jgi:NADPH:quinone reductase